jgi:hypothetical protein
VDGVYFGIAMDHEAHVISILRDQMYSDKIMAVLREYGANALDAQRSVGKGDVPFSVHIPNALSPEFKIRDYGPGLSRDDVFNVYCKYGASTKRDSDDYVGMLGIGSKSAFAYTDSFTVTSWHNGVKSVYVALIDESNKGTMNLLSEELIDDTSLESGIEISLAVDNGDIDEFTKKARDLYRNFRPIPNINISMPEASKDEISLKSGRIDTCSRSYRYDVWYVVMGCIPYRLNTSQIAGLPQFVSRMNGVIYMDIGDVHVAASREELKYTDKTKASVISKINELGDEYCAWVMASLTDASLSNWEKRNRARSSVYSGFSWPADIKSLADSSVRVQWEPGISVQAGLNGYSDRNVIYIHSDTRFIIKDDKRRLKGFKINRNDFIVSGNSVTNITGALNKLQKSLKASALDGAPVVMLSSIPWTPLPKKAANVNSKHAHRVFVFEPSTGGYHRPLSQFWKTVDHVPNDTDVYVEINGFEPINNDGLYEWYSTDRDLAGLIGETMPQIIGYKVSDKKPLKKRRGTKYSEWRKLLHKKVYANSGAHQLLMMSYISQKWFLTRPSNELAGKLADKHPIKGVIESVIAANTDKTVAALRTGIRNLSSREDSPPALAAESMIGDVLKKYPLLKGDPRELLSNDRVDRHLWLDYIRLVDRDEERKKDE